MKIVADAYIPYIRDYFANQAELVLLPGRDIHARDVVDADVLLVRSITHVNAALLAGSRVKFVGSVTAGADHLDTAWLDQVGIVWCVAAGFNAPPVADYVVCVMAALERRYILKLTGSKAVVVGVGNVGKLVVERLKLLGLEVTQCDPLRAGEEDSFSSVLLNEIENADLISLHAPLTRAGEHPTYHMIDAAFLKRQKPGCVLLNASRGAVIDSQALLREGTHLHWCLDVFEHEPHVDKAILKQTLLATPHIAGYSVQSKIRGIEMIYQRMTERGLVEKQAVAPVAMPRQTLSFAGKRHHWQDIVLGVFNPLVMTEMMLAALLPAENVAPLFDEMRNQFHYRHEFAYTQVPVIHMPNDDVRIAAKLGISLG